MTFVLSHHHDVRLFEVGAQLTVSNRQELKELFLAELAQGERRLLLDFTGTEFIDSSGLGLLVSLAKKVREANGELRLANLDPDLRSLFELTKLTSLFVVTDDRDEALARLTSPVGSASPAATRATDALQPSPEAAASPSA